MEPEKLIVSNSVLLGEAVLMLESGKDVVIPTKGNSMLPFIRGERDTVTLRKMDAYEVGDIVLARMGGKYVLHRIWSLEGQKVTLMGDGNLRGKEYCSLGDLRGTVISINKPSGKTVDPFSDSHRRQAAAWRKLMPFRRIILGIYRRLI